MFRERKERNHYRPDPLRVESGVTIITLSTHNGAGASRYACRISGSGKNEHVAVIGVATQEVGDLNAARHAARRACEKGRETVVATDVNNLVFLVEIINDANAAQVAESILAARRDERRQSFAISHATGNFLAGAKGAPTNGANPTTPKLDPEEIALGYVTKENPFDELMVNAQFLLNRYNSDEARAALVKAFKDVASIVANQDPSLSRFIFLFAEGLERNDMSEVQIAYTLTRPG